MCFPFELGGGLGGIEEAKGVAHLLVRQGEVDVFLGGYDYGRTEQRTTGTEDEAPALAFDEGLVVDIDEDVFPGDLGGVDLEVAADHLLDGSDLAADAGREFDRVDKPQAGGEGLDVDCLDFVGCGHRCAGLGLRMYYTFCSVVKRLMQDILNRPEGLDVAGQFLVPPLPGRPEFALNQDDEALH